MHEELKVLTLKTIETSPVSGIKQVVIWTGFEASGIHHIKETTSKDDP